MAGLEKTGPLPPLSSEETVWVSLLTLLILAIGTVTIQYQWRQLSKRIQQMRGAGGCVESEEIEVALCSKDLREVQQKIQQRQRQSYQALANELQNMREVQSEVKSKLAGLQALVDRISEQKQERARDN